MGLGIMLMRIKLGLPEIRKALLDLNDQSLSVDELRAISRQLPTPEEVCTVRITRIQLQQLVVLLDCPATRLRRRHQASEGRPVLQSDHDHSASLGAAGMHDLPEKART